MIIKKKNVAACHEFKLFVSGASPNSVRAINNIQRILEAYIPGQYNLEIIDVYQNREVAQHEQIIALPMLIRTLPLPVRRLIGDMSHESKVVDALGFNQTL